MTALFMALSRICSKDSKVLLEILLIELTFFTLLLKTRLIFDHFRKGDSLPYLSIDPFSIKSVAN